jgi:phosphoserine phosphatase
MHQFITFLSVLFNSIRRWIAGNEVCIFDWDGTSAQAGGMQTTPNQAPTELHMELLRLVLRGYRIILLSGQPMCVLEKAREQFPWIIRQAIIILASDYGSSILYRGKKHKFLPEQEKVAYIEVAARLRDLLISWGAVVDPRATILALNAFWHEEHAFRVAMQSEQARKQLLEILGQNADHVRYQFNTVDFSFNMLPKSAGKHNLVAYLQRMDYRIVLAAGDTSSDQPMLEAAEWAIVCHDEGHGPSGVLLKAIEGRQAFVAPEDAPHGHGLAAGLRKFLS